MVSNAFRSEIFSLKPVDATGRHSVLAMCLKILIPKQMLQRLPTALKLKWVIHLNFF